MLSLTKSRRLYDMRIVKTRNIRSNEVVTATQEIEAAAKPDYSEARKHIECAIRSLSEPAKTDIVAKDSIANLSVVMFDLL